MYPHLSNYYKTKDHLTLWQREHYTSPPKDQHRGHRKPAKHYESPLEGSETSQRHPWKRTSQQVVQPSCWGPRGKPSQGSRTITSAKALQGILWGSLWGFSQSVFNENPVVAMGGPLDRASPSVRPGVTRRGNKVGIRFRLQGRSTAPSRQSPQVERESDQSTRERLSPIRESSLNLEDSATPTECDPARLRLHHHDLRHQVAGAER